MKNKVENYTFEVVEPFNIDNIPLEIINVIVNDLLSELERELEKSEK